MCVCHVCNPTRLSRCPPLFLPPQEGEQVGAPSFCARWLHIDKSIRLHLITRGTGATNLPASTPTTLGSSVDHSSISPRLNHPPDPPESFAMGKEGEEARKKKIKQRGWQHMNHLASIWMTSMLMQRGPRGRVAKA